MFDHVSLYFYPKEHEYRDEFGNKYTSVTQTLDKFVIKQDWTQIAKSCEKIGRNPLHPKYLKYKNKSYRDIMNEWNVTKIQGLDRGNECHDFIETEINKYNGYGKIEDRFSLNRIYTIPDLLSNAGIGEINLDFFIRSGLKIRYPKIYNIISNFVGLGYRIFAEVGVYNPNYLISGLIDLLLIKDNKYFVIIDWKTNKGDIPHLSGYYDKDENGEEGAFIRTFEFYNEPISHIEHSVRNHYTLQVSSYDYLVEGFGLIHKGNILCHITHDKYTEDNITNEEERKWIGLERVNPIVIPYWKNDIELLYEFVKDKTPRKTQTSIVFKH